MPWKKVTQRDGKTRFVALKPKQRGLFFAIVMDLHEVAPVGGRATSGRHRWRLERHTSRYQPTSPSPPSPPHPLPLPPADRDEGGREPTRRRHEAHHAFLGWAQSRGADHEPEIRQEHEPAFPRDRQALLPAVAFGRKPVAVLVGFVQFRCSWWLAEFHAAHSLNPCPLAHPRASKSSLACSMPSRLRWHS